MKQFKLLPVGLLLFAGVWRVAEAHIANNDDPIDLGCPENYIGFIRHPYDCRLFYHCYPGKRPCLFECAEGLYFNPDPQWCDFPSNVPDCEGGTPPPPSATPGLPGKNERSLNYRNINRQSFAKAGRSLEKMLESRDATLKYPEACETTQHI